MNTDVGHKGIEIDGNELKLLTSPMILEILILDDRRDSLHAALNTLKLFGGYSGLIINTGKNKVVQNAKYGIDCKKSYSSN